MSEYLDLPAQIKREFVYELMKTTIAARVLGNFTKTDPIIWADRIAQQAARELADMTEAGVDEVLRQYDQASQGYGVSKVEIKLDKGLSKDA